jgi:choline dehydrogenase-like flavoprotein
MQQKNHSLEEKYDYIIIGTDSGGPVMAATISEGSTETLLLLETDSAQNFISVITLVAIFFQKISID